MVGLHLNIPNNWWPDFDNGSLNQGHIAGINLNGLSSYYFQVKLVNEPGAHYAMRYDSILLYADENQPGFSQYCLPPRCPGNTDDKIAQVSVPQKIRWMVDDDYTDKEDCAANEAIEFDNREDDKSDNKDDNNGGDDDNNDDLHSKDMTKKKRKKGTHSKQTTLKKTKSVAATKHNKKSRHINNTTINHDHVISGKGDSVVEGDANGKDSDFDIDFFEEQRYENTKATNWMIHTDGQPGRVIHPIRSLGQQSSSVQIYLTRR